MNCPFSGLNAKSIIVHWVDNIQSPPHPSPFCCFFFPKKWQWSGCRFFKTQNQASLNSIKITTTISAKGQNLLTCWKSTMLSFDPPHGDSGSLHADKHALQPSSSTLVHWLRTVISFCFFVFMRTGYLPLPTMTAATGAKWTLKEAH